MWNGFGFHNGMGFGMGFGMLFFLLLIVVVLVLAFRGLSGGGSSAPPSARELLDQRYARGEIGREEYERMRADLER